MNNRYRQNMLCPCGSMKKYHRCCGRKERSGMGGAVIAATALAGAVLCVKGVSRGNKVQSLAGIFLLVAAGLWYIFSAMPARHREANFQSMRSYGNVAPVKGGLFDTEDPEIVKRKKTKQEESGE